MTKEQIIELIKMREAYASKKEQEYSQKWSNNIKNDFEKEQNYTQMMMWWAVKTTIETILEDIERSNT